MVEKGIQQQQRAQNLGLVLYECVPHIPPSGTPIIGRNTVGSCLWMALSSLKDRHSYSSKWNNPDTQILVRKPELDVTSLQCMEGHLQTSMEMWVNNNRSEAVLWLDALPGINHMHGMQKQIVLILTFWPERSLHPCLSIIYYYIPLSNYLTHHIFIIMFIPHASVISRCVM